MYSLIFIFILHGFITNRLNDQLPVGLLAQLVRALHWYRRGQGFESRTSLNFFQAFFSQLQKLHRELAAGQGVAGVYVRDSKGPFTHAIFCAFVVAIFNAILSRSSSQQKLQVQTSGDFYAICHRDIAVVSNMLET